jgi:hypothetical protein
MTGRALLFAVSLPLLAMAPVGAMAADVQAQSSSQYLRHNDPFHSLNDLDNTEVLPGNKADFPITAT